MRCSATAWSAFSWTSTTCPFFSPPSCVVQNYNISFALVFPCTNHRHACWKLPSLASSSTAAWPSGHIGYRSLAKPHASRCWAWILPESRFQEGQRAQKLLLPVCRWSLRASVHQQIMTEINFWVIEFLCWATKQLFPLQCDVGLGRWQMETWDTRDRNSIQHYKVVFISIYFLVHYSSLFDAFVSLSPFYPKLQ